MRARGHPTVRGVILGYTKTATFQSRSKKYIFGHISRRWDGTRLHVAHYCIVCTEFCTESGAIARISRYFVFQVGGEKMKDVAADSDVFE